MPGGKSFSTRSRHSIPDFSGRQHSPILPLSLAAANAQVAMLDAS